MHNCGAVAIGGITSSTLFELFPLFFLFKVDSMMNSNWVLFKGPLPSDYPFIYMLIQGDASKARFNARKTITRDMPLKQTRGETPRYSPRASVLDGGGKLSESITSLQLLV